jgi:hypothetical protein
MSVVAGAIAMTFAKIMAVGGIALFFKPLLSGIVRALALWVRLRVIRHRAIGRVAETLPGQ